MVDELVSATRRGDFIGVKYYLAEENVDVDSYDGDGKTALYEASNEGHIEIVNYLISKGANVNAITHATQKYWPDTPLFSAVWRGHIEVAKALIQNGAKTDTVVEGKNLLDEAIYSRNSEMLGLILSHGFDINQRDDLGMTPLATAMSTGANKIVMFLLENGADYKKTSICRPRRNRILPGSDFLPIYNAVFGHCPCHIDHSKKLIKCIELLLKHIERKEGREGMIDYINRNDNSRGSTALHAACEFEYYDAAKILLQCGADPNIRNMNGKKPYELAKSSGSELEALF